MAPLSYFLIPILCGLESFSGTHGVLAEDVITEDVYFYGQSPPVYPSPEIAKRGDWAAAYTKAKALVSQLTLEEKVNITGGITPSNGCGGAITAIERVGFPGLCLSDAGNGLRGTDFVSSYASGLHVGASWNKELAYNRANAMGNEFKKKGVNVALGPVVGPVGRVVRGGRNWEGFSVDPYLSGALVYETVTGIQERGVMTSTKHYIGNEQEGYRNPSGNVSALSSNIDDKTMHELYLWPFQDAVKAGTTNIMCSYQRVNNSYGCANSKTLNGLLKTELGFQGFVVTDWGAQHAGVATALSGLDMVMPSGYFWGDNLTEAVNNGSVPESRVTDMATRILTSWYKLDQDKNFLEPGSGMPSDITQPHDIVDARDRAANAVRQQGAVEGHVLVKNTKDTLPLKSPKMLSIFGYSAKATDNYGPASSTSTTLEKYGWLLGLQATNSTAIMSVFMGSGIGEDMPSIAINGTILSGGGSGATTPSNFLAPFDALRTRAYSDGTAVFHDLAGSSPAVDAASDACIVFGNAWASEGYDRPSVHDDYTDALVKAVADQCSKTIVVLHNAGARLVDQFINHENVSAVIFAHLPGQDSGAALVSLLYGEENFSGKLPYTVAKNESDYGHVLTPDAAEGVYKYFPQSNFDEGVYIDYRHFDSKNITPRYEFGYGLSYTTFQLSSLKTNKASRSSVAAYPTGAVVDGGQSDLWDTVATVKATIKNTGQLAGAEVVQLYLGIPGAPAKQLRGFEKPVLQPGKATQVSFSLNRRDLSVWDTTAQKWKLQKGDYKVYVGTSSRNLPLTGTLKM
ncbi:glycoside hydrolase family 3 protein [Thelonectria olida]|uniref:beta-glucosidase n=1 Tax=Thelonectria olida TaxID=1576542 RepID=A0A9P8WH65_9HYPO|nr:glycoside hydrolase family 3 protein [Thelonectria olida]